MTAKAAILTNNAGRGLRMEKAIAGFMELLSGAGLDAILPRLGRRNRLEFDGKGVVLRFQDR
jgi:hypothetical protein